jgi:hypothetical protein
VVRREAVVVGAALVGWYGAILWWWGARGCFGRVVRREAVVVGRARLLEMVRRTEWHPDTEVDPYGESLKSPPGNMASSLARKRWPPAWARQPS